MEERNLVFSYNEEKCKVGGQRGILKTLKVEEIMPNGDKENVHTEIRFRSKTANPAYLKLLRLVKRTAKATNRRAA